MTYAVLMVSKDADALDDLLYTERVETNGVVSCLLVHLDQDAAFTVSHTMFTNIREIILT